MRVRSKRRGVVSSRLHLSGVSYKLISRVMEQLTFDNPDYETVRKYSPWGPPANIPEKLEFAEVDELHQIKLMRGALYLLNNQTRDIVRNIAVKDKRVFAETVFPEAKLKPNKEQEHLLNILENSISCGLRPFGTYLFLASTAVGKTILQALVAKRFSQRTLVICPTEQILHAWYGDLKKLFKFTSKQLGLIKASTFRIGDPITLASPATLARRTNRWREIYDSFGTVIVDEVHTVTAPKLYEFLSECPAAYMVGATATQETRAGGRNLHLLSLFGTPLVELNTYHKETASSMQISQVNAINTDFIYEGQYDNVDWVDLGLALTSDDSRNAQIVNAVYDDWLQKRSILVVTKFREHLEILTALLNEKGITNVNVINGDTNADRRYTQRLLEAINRREVTCIVATMQAIKAGANIPVLDSLHIAIPPANKRDFEQLMGRIRRKAEGKTSAIITYYVDTHVGYMMHLYRRIVIPTFRKLELPGYQNIFVA